MNSLMEKVRLGKPIAGLLDPTGLPAGFFTNHVFDDLPLLDDFNRANEDPLSGSNAWMTGATGYSTVTLEIASNLCAQLDIATAGRSVYGTTFGQDQAACITVPTLPVDADDGIEIWLRGQVVASGTPGTRFHLLPAAASSQFNIDVDASTVAVTRSFSAGDQFGGMVVGSLALMWHGVSGVWTCVAATTTTARAGCVVLGIRDNEARLDNFRAGTLT